MSKTTQVFRVKLAAIPSIAPSCTGDAMKPQVFTFTTRNPGDLLVSVGPLDRELFTDGDMVKVIVQRCGKERTK